jgi:hypothetical protein
VAFDYDEANARLRSFSWQLRRDRLLLPVERAGAYQLEGGARRRGEAKHCRVPVAGRVEGAINTVRFIAPAPAASEGSLDRWILLVQLPSPGMVEHRR